MTPWTVNCHPALTIAIILVGSDRCSVGRTLLHFMWGDAALASPTFLVFQNSSYLPVFDWWTLRDCIYDFHIYVSSLSFFHQLFTLDFEALEIWQGDLRGSIRYERSQLTSFLSDNPIILPCKGILYGVAVNMPVSYLKTSSIFISDTNAPSKVFYYVRLCGGFGIYVP